MNASDQGMTTDLIIQYSIVGGIILAALAWIVWKSLRKNKKNSGSSCCGCALEDSCKKKKL